MDNRLYSLALTQIPNVGNTTARQLISYLSGVEKVFTANAAVLGKVPNIGSTTAKQIIEHKEQALVKAKKILETVELSGDKLILFTDPEYPARFKLIPDCPTLFYLRGKPNLDAEFSVAIVGTRNSTTYGNEVTTELVQGLAHLNCTIVSGLAYGIDIAAHKAALKEGIPTIGALAGGFDKMYPSEHKKIAVQMCAENGGLISEQSYGVKPEAFNFPARNRLIAGLADATIIVEAKAKGGALITAALADGYNREVFAVPGDIKRETSHGTNNLIRDRKAICYTDPQSFLAEMGWEANKIKPRKTPNLTEIETMPFSDEEKDIIRCLIGGNQQHIDELARKTLIPINKLAGLLLNLEFQGLIKTLPGKNYAYASR